MFQLYAMMPHWQEMSNGSTWNPLQSWIILPNLQVAKLNKWKHTYDPFDVIICQIGHAKGASTLRPPLNFKGDEPKGQNNKICLWSIIRGIGDTASCIAWGGVGAQCFVWIIRHVAKNDWSSKTQSCLQTRNINGSKNKSKWGGKKMLDLYGGHQTIPSNVDWYEGTILKRCWNVCQGGPTSFK